MLYELSVVSVTLCGFTVSCKCGMQAAELDWIVQSYCGDPTMVDDDDEAAAGTVLCCVVLLCCVYLVGIVYEGVEAGLALMFRVNASLLLMSGGLVAIDHHGICLVTCCSLCVYVLLRSG